MAANPYDSPFSGSRATGGNTTYYTKASGRGSTTYNRSRGAVSNPYNQSFNATGDAPNQDYSGHPTATATKVQPKAAPPPKPQSTGSKFLNFAKGFANSMTSGEQKFAQGITRTLPGGTNDLNAAAKSSQADQNTQKTYATLFKQGKISKSQYQKATSTAANQANQTSSGVKTTEKSMPTKTQIGLGAASTGADILTAGSFSKIKATSTAGKAAKVGVGLKRAKELESVINDTSKAGKAANVAGHLTSNAAAGGLNAAAGGGDKKTIISNAAAGAALPEVLRLGSKAVAKGASVAADKLPHNTTKDAKSLLTNTKTQTLLEHARANQPIMNTAVNPDHVSQGLIKGEIHQTPVHELSLGPEAAGKKVDNAKVAQYTKQIKDGEPVEPIVTHEVNGQKVVVDGQHRLAAAQKMGIDTVPTVEKIPGAEPLAPSAEPKTASASQATPTAELSKVESPAQPKLQDTASAKPGDVSLAKSTPSDTVPVSEQKANIAPTGEAPKRTLTPSETAHMEPIGGYTHSKDMVNDYADMLRETEKGLKGGQLIRTEGETGVGNYKRISEHGKFYREFYRENGKPPTKADYHEEAVRQLTSGKDAYGASGDYKKLLERESQPLPRHDFTPQVTGEARTSGSAQNAEAKAVQQGLVKEFKDKAAYSGGSYKEEAAKAVDLVEKDPQKAMDIATGKAPGDNTIHEVAVARALENKALKEGDVETLTKLASSPRHAVTSEAAQRLGAEGYGEQNSVVKSLATIRKVRQDAFEKRTGKTAATAVSDEVKQIRAAQPKVTAKTWSDFLDGIKC